MYVKQVQKKYQIEFKFVEGKLSNNLLKALS